MSLDRGRRAREETIRVNSNLKTSQTAHQQINSTPDTKGTSHILALMVPNHTFKSQERGRKQNLEYIRANNTSNVAKVGAEDWLVQNVELSKRLYFCELPDSPDSSVDDPSINESDEGRLPLWSPH